MFVNYLAEEINVRVAFLGPSRRMTEVGSYIFDRLSEGSKSDVSRTPVHGGELSSYDFLPEGLGRIRGFDVRVHVATLAASEMQDAALDAVVHHADAFIIYAQPTARVADLWRRILEALDRSRWPASARRLIVLAEPGALDEETLAELPGDVEVVQTQQSACEGCFDALKAGTRAALEAMRDYPPRRSASDEPLEALPIVPLVDTLRLLERRLGKPLSEDEVTSTVDNAPAIMLPASGAASVRDERGSDVGLENAWQDWRRLRSGGETTRSESQ